MKQHEKKNCLREVQVSYVLLRYSHLSKTQQARFVEGLNAYTFASPPQRRAFQSHWQGQVADQEAAEAV